MTRDTGLSSTRQTVCSSCSSTRANRTKIPAPTKNGMAFAPVFFSHTSSSTMGSAVHTAPAVNIEAMAVLGMVSSIMSPP